MVINSRIMNLLMLFMFRRKENLCGISKIVKIMNDFYIFEIFVENFVKKLEFKLSIFLLEMKI